MKINLNETELHEAIAGYIEEKGLVIPEGKTVNISLTAGRGANGFYADVEIVDGDVKVTAPEDDSPFKEDTETPTSENQPALDLDLDS